MNVKLVYRFSVVFSVGLMITGVAFAACVFFSTSLTGRPEWMGAATNAIVGAATVMAVQAALYIATREAAEREVRAQNERKIYAEMLAAELWTAAVRIEKEVIVTGDLAHYPSMKSLVDNRLSHTRIHYLAELSLHVRLVVAFVDDFSYGGRQ